MMRFWWENILLFSQMLWVCPACERDDTAHLLFRALQCEVESWSTLVTTILKVGVNPKQISVLFCVCAFLTQTTNFTKISNFNWKPLCCRRRWKAARAVSSLFSNYLIKVFVSIVFFIWCPSSRTSDIFDCDAYCGILYVVICIFFFKTWEKSSWVNWKAVESPSLFSSHLKLLFSL